MLDYSKLEQVAPLVPRVDTPKHLVEAAAHTAPFACQGPGPCSLQADRGGVDTFAPRALECGLYSPGHLGVRFIGG